ncbi:Bug family tripartite tricarboxylate transporter substrate binding protein [Falsiroseomonas sp. HW251]|uniref:Bug family tripartite tricarboxylate transporter substrate binding protein n=1 Tax=Falsiroseomonas sp. HW251 TaxID=3390998 RepID=UPI003D31DB33
MSSPAIARRTALLGLLATPALAQTEAAWPTRPIRIIVGFPPGQSIDIVTRIVAERLGPVLGQPAVVENRPGAGGRIGFEALKRAAPDGYTLGCGSNGPLTVIPTLYPDTPYDVERDLQPVVTLARAPYVLFVRPDSPIRDIAGLKALAEARPGALSYGSPGVGTMQHLMAQMLATALRVNIQHVPYRGGAEVLTDIMGGRLDLAVDALPGALAAIRGGQVRPVAITSGGRNELLPGVPTLTDLGLPDVQANGWFGILAPSGLPARISTQLFEAFTRAVTMPETVAALRDAGLSPYVIDSAAFRTLLRDDTARFREVIRVSNIQVN